MCTKLLDWFNNEFLFMFESKKFKTSNSEQLHHNIKIIIDEPKISPSNSNESIPSTPSSIGLISKDEYDLYTWDIL